jgi:hypothetical protein
MKLKDLLIGLIPYGVVYLLAYLVFKLLLIILGEM